MNNTPRLKGRGVLAVPPLFLATRAHYAHQHRGPSASDPQDLPPERSPGPLTVPSRRRLLKARLAGLFRTEAPGPIHPLRHRRVLTNPGSLEARLAGYSSRSSLHFVCDCRRQGIATNAHLSTITSRSLPRPCRIASEVAP